jgi:hypothetical protein
MTMEDDMTLVRQPWSEREIAQIKKMAGELPLNELARKLNRTEAATRVQAWKLGFSVKSDAAVCAPEPRPAVSKTRTIPEPVEVIVAPAAVERALAIYQQLQPRDPSVIVQAKKILTQHIYGMVDRGEQDEQRLTVGGLAHLKAIERDHVIKSAHGAKKAERNKAYSRVLTGQRVRAVLS